MNKNKTTKRNNRKEANQSKSFQITNDFVCLDVHMNSYDNEDKGVYNEDGSLNLNPNSMTVLKDCYLEPDFAKAKAYDRFQFVRQGFFCVDAKDSKPDALVFNRIVSLKSSFKLPKAE